jgi:hypothetical protein
MASHLLENPYKEIGKQVFVETTQHVMQSSVPQLFFLTHGTPNFNNGS